MGGGDGSGRRAAKVGRVVVDAIVQGRSVWRVRKSVRRSVRRGIYGSIAGRGHVSA